MISNSFNLPDFMHLRGAGGPRQWVKVLNPTGTRSDQSCYPFGGQSKRKEIGISLRTFPYLPPACLWPKRRPQTA
jgi:hypothetical protein